MAKFCNQCRLPLQEGELNLCGVCDAPEPPATELVKVGNHYEVVDTDDRIFDEWRPKISYDNNYNKWYVLIQISGDDSADGEIKCYYDTLDEVIRDMVTGGLHTAQKEE